MVQVALFAAAVLSFLFALVIFVNNVRSTLFRLYFLFGVFSAFWMIVNGLAISGPVDLVAEEQLHVARFITPLALGTSLTFYLFLRYFTKHTLGRITLLPIVASVTVSAFAFTDHNVYLGANNELLLGSLYPFYLLVVLLNVALVFHVLYGKSRHRADVKMQIHYLRVGALVAVIPTIMFGAVLPLFSSSELSNIGPLFALSFLLFAGVAIVKHHLFDVKLAAVRTVAYALTIVLLACIYFVLAYIVSVVLFGRNMRTTNFDVINIVIVLILVFVFQPLKRFFDRITDAIFFRDTYDSEEFITEVGRLLTATTDLRGLLEALSRHMMSTFKVDQAFFALQYEKEGEHRMVAGIPQRSKVPKYDIDRLTEYVTKAKTPIVQTDTFYEENIDIWRMLSSHKIGLALPLHQGDKIVGFLFLGERLAGSFAKKDLTVLRAISNELVIGIQNTLSVYELRELNATLQQRIDVATKELRSSNAQLKHLDEVKDEFISMASHQLRTPLTSVKGYVSMVLEGDAGAINKQQKELLFEAFKSSERMVDLIADFLNVSRLQTGKFVIEKTLFDLKQVVKEEVSDLQMIAKGHNITLRLKVSGAGQFLVMADEAKLRQVIMNYIDNAIYYSHPRSTITVTLEKQADHVALSVVDTGIGVPEDEQARLFHKFYRAKNARKQRPDGTGVGLYLARRVIMAHGGSIIFSSKEGKGSTFGFRMALAAQSAAKPKTKR